MGARAKPDHINCTTQRLAHPLYRGILSDMKAWFLLLPLLVLPAIGEEDDYSKESKSEAPHVFGWPFMEWKKMQPRGGSTQGSEVTLAEKPREAWHKLQAEDLSKYQRDCQAIFAMAGSYRVSFDFLETLGFSEDYEPPKPYFSWGTEHVQVIRYDEDFITLQHTLVMYFKNDKGEVEGPMVMKHWRQDWVYEPEFMLTYQGDRVWEKVPAPNAKGRWCQRVWQVDDSPRYQVMGEWSHEGGMSTWRSDNCPRPLPRREFSVRDDYNVLEGVHEITLSAQGWLHTQNNRKLNVKGDKKEYVGLEIGVDRYEEISEPDLKTPFMESWKKTNPFWEAVRRAWDDLMEKRDRIELKPEVEGKKLWQVFFAKAGEVEEGGDTKPEDHAKFVNDTLKSFLVE